MSAVRRSKCRSGRSPGTPAHFDYWPDAEERWGLAEGCESALAAFQLTKIPTAAAIHAGNIPKVTPPSWARHVTIFADYDDAGMGPAAETLKRYRALPQIETVRVVTAADIGRDMADLL